jgi:glycine/D-amino acid oxidase-like deaminating enzyme
MKLQSGYPFSLIRYGLPYSYPKLNEPITTDVVIVGGGISGALTAHHLQKAGVDCTVVDGRTIGLGSTCASTSLIQYEIDVPLYKLIELIGEKKAITAYHDCKDAIFKLHDVSNAVGFSGFDFNKSLYFAATKKDVKFLKKEYDVRKQNDLKVNWLDERDVKERFGFHAPGAILSKNAAYTDAYLLTHHLLQAGIKAGLRVYDRTFIKKFDFHTKSVTLTTAENVIIKARNVVFATGYEVTEQIAKKIVKLHSTYVTISENMVDQNPFQEKDVMIWNTADPYLYMRGTQDGRVIAGGRDENFSSPARRDALINRKSRQLVNDYKRLFPDSPFKPEFNWTGTFGSTNDGLPFIGSFGNIRHRYFALGFGGNGITFSIIAAEMIRDLILGKTPKNTQLYSFDRV